LAPAGLESWLLERGYALAASSYARGGWAVAEAVPDQLLTISTFTSQVARPYLTLAWGDSMGGLITLALAEDPYPAIQGAVSACGSLGGSLTMMNSALDGAFAFVTLQAPASGLQVVGVNDDRVNSSRASEALATAMQTEAGRARIALSGVLGGVPGWTQAGSAPPAEDDEEAQLQQMVQTFVAAVFPPRTDQERRAHGVTSWNVGVDYRKVLKATGRQAWVQHFYQRAHLSLKRDLQRLNAAPHIQADPAAVDYLRAHYEPQGQPRVPLLSLHTLGDGITSPSLQAAYAQRVRGAARNNYRTSWVRAAGHCAFTRAEYAAALSTLQTRIQTGHWHAGADALNAAAARTGLGSGRFVAAAVSAPGRP
jgi:hypothetical protein